MRGCRPSGIIGSDGRLGNNRTKKALREREAEVTYWPGSTPITVAVCGDPIVGRALVLLLQTYRYDARFLPASSFREPESLKGVQLLLLTPMSELSTERREALLALLRDTIGAMKITILELVTPSGGTQGGARDGSEHVVLWPCSPEELKGQIETVLLTGPGRISPPVEVCTGDSV
jgi:hypothetical protein